jgi:GT2 family glycosyltransferase
MNKSSVGVVILNWNRMDDTLECVDSIYRSSYTDLDVIVVDNGSDDGTVTALQDQFQGICIIKNEKNIGYAEGNNRGIKAAIKQNVNYILVLNNDTLVDPSAIEILVNTYQCYPNAGILSPLILWYPDQHKIWFAGSKWIPETATFIHIGSGQNESDLQLTSPVHTDYASGCALFFNTSVVDQIGYFDPRFFLTWEETNWCFRAKRLGYSPMLVPESRVLHKVSSSFEGGWRGPRYQYYYTRNRLLWIEKNLYGQEKFKAFIRCLRELFWWLIDLKTKAISNQELDIIIARLYGGFHYFIRVFGQSSKYDN